MQILYKKDSKGKLRSWTQEINGDAYRTIAGLVEGSKTVSGWTTCSAKNVGRANETTPEQQAQAEVEANIIKKLGGEYYDNPDDVDTPKYFLPLLAQKWNDRKSKINYTAGVHVQPKLDGIRCITKADGMWSRKGKPIVSCPHIREALVPFFQAHPNAILDGELYNHALRDEFEELCSLIKRTKTSPESFAKTKAIVQYHLYDHPTAEDATFAVRQATMVHHLVDTGTLDNNQCIQIVDTAFALSETTVNKAYDLFIDRGYEGGMIRLPGPYEHVYSKYLLKRKDFEDKEFEIIRIEEGNGNWAGAAKRIVFRLEDGTESAAGIAGKLPYCTTVFQERDQYIGKEATIRYFGRTKNGKPRIAVAHALHKTDRW